MHEASLLNSVGTSHEKKNQKETGVELFSDKTCQVTFGFAYYVLLLIHTVSVHRNRYFQTVRLQN